MDALNQWIADTLSEYDAKTAEAARLEAEKKQKERQENMEYICSILSAWNVPHIEGEVCTDEGCLRFKGLKIMHTGHYEVGKYIPTGLCINEKGYNTYCNNAEELALFLRDYLKRQSDEDAFADDAPKGGWPPEVYGTPTRE